MNERERVYIVPHWAGFVFGAAVFALFVIAYFSHGFGGPAQTLVISFVVAGIVALIQTNDNLRGIVLLSCHSRPVAVGEDAVMELTFANESPRQRLGLKVRIRSGWSLKGDAWIPAIEPMGRATVRISVPTTTRGRFSNPSIWVSSSLPVGLCFSWKVFADSGEYYVYPAPRGQPLTAFEGGGDQAGPRLQIGGSDVDGHRAYEPGDLLSRLDWKVFAKNGKLLVKTLAGMCGTVAMLRWEDTALLGNPETRLEQMSFWLIECLNSRRPFQLDLGPYPDPLTDKNPAACLRALAGFSTPS